MAEGKNIASFLIDVGFNLNKQSLSDVGGALTGIRKDAILAGRGGLGGATPSRAEGGIMRRAGIAQAAMTGGVYAAMMGATKIPGVGKKLAAFAAVVAGATAAVSYFSQRMFTPNLALVDFAKKYDIDVQRMRSLSALTKEFGGKESDTLGDVSRVAAMRDSVRMGNVGWMRNVAISGIDFNEMLNAKTALKGYLSLSKQFNKMDKPGQRIASQALGFSDATLRLFKIGEDEIERGILAQKARRTFSDEDIERQRKLRKYGQRISVAAGAYLDNFSRGAQYLAVKAGDLFFGDKALENEKMISEDRSKRSPKAAFLGNTDLSEHSIPQTLKKDSIIVNPSESKSQTKMVTVVNVHLDGRVIKKMVNEEIEKHNQISLDAIDYFGSRADVTAGK